VAGWVPGTEVTLVDDPAITETGLVSALPGVVLVEVVLILVADVGVAELPGSAGAFAGICGDYSREGVFPVDIDVASHQRAEACDIFVSHGVSLGADCCAPRSRSGRTGCRRSRCCAGWIASAVQVDHGLMGSELVRLAAAGRISVAADRVIVVDRGPCGDAALDAALDSMAAARREVQPRSWVGRPRRGIQCLPHRPAETRGRRTRIIRPT